MRQRDMWLMVYLHCIVAGHLKLCEIPYTIFRTPLGQVNICVTHT